MSIQTTIARGKKKILTLLNQDQFNKLIADAGETGLQFWAISASSQGATHEQIEEGLQFIKNDKLGVTPFLLGHCIVVGVGLKK